MKVINSSPKNSTANEISAKGEASERVLKVCFLGTAILILCVSGVITIWCLPELSKEVWLILGPVITSIAYSLVGQIR